MSLPVILARSCLFLCLVLLCACASIPLSTALRLSSLDERALVQLEPADIRIKVALPRGNTLNPEETRLVLRLQPDGEAAQVATMPLRLVGSSQGERSSGFFSPAVAVTTYDLALSTEGAAQLRGLQRNVMRLRSESGKVDISVNVSFSEIAEGTKEMRFWVDIKLRANDAYMTLFDGAEIKFKMAEG
ncbi:hypothetical protein [Stenotrophomonas terrae]|uniref:hypothetical protein n=1 Tax=Stenotrophomonas terrae TaxID=405446 RepID=UPI000B27900C|nr:hypothetical protein [Stenotrophomonas terrae]